MTTFESIFGGGGIFILLFLIVMAVLWFLLPFAVFGTKSILKDILDHETAIETELNLLNSELKLLTNAFTKIVRAAKADSSHSASPDQPSQAGDRRRLTNGSDT